MTSTLKDHDGKISIGGRNINNMRFADDIDDLAKNVESRSPS